MTVSAEVAGPLFWSTRFTSRHRTEEWAGRGSDRVGSGTGHLRSNSDFTPSHCALDKSLRPLHLGFWGDHNKINGIVGCSEEFSGWIKCPLPPREPATERGPTVTMKSLMAVTVSCSLSSYSFSSQELFNKTNLNIIKHIPNEFQT